MPSPLPCPWVVADKDRNELKGVSNDPADLLDGRAGQAHERAPIADWSRHHQQIGALGWRCGSRSPDQARRRRRGGWTSEYDRRQHVEAAEAIGKVPIRRAQRHRIVADEPGPL